MNTSLHTSQATGGTWQDPLARAREQFAALMSYRATIRSTASDGERQVIRYYYRKPGWIRMEFEQPHKGLVLIYDPQARKVRVWPFGVHRLQAPSMSPDNPLLRSRNGQRIDHSDIGALFSLLFDLREHGSMTFLESTEITGRPAMGLCIAGDAGVSRAGVHRFHVWLNEQSFPVRVESFDHLARPIETVDMSDAEIDVAFPARFFLP